MIDSKELPLEYQLFALSFQEEGAIVSFAEELPVHEVCAIDENAGIKEFYQALLDYHNLTEQPIVEPIAFRSWLETSRDTYTAIDAFIGIDTFMDTVMSIETSSSKDVIAVLKDRHKTRKQLNFIQELQSIFQSKDHKTDADFDKIDKLTAQIAELQQRVDYNPLAKVKFATDIVDSIDDMFVIPPFLSTPFETLNCALGYTSDGGMFRGAVHAIVATSGKGKSTLAKTLANHWLDDGYSVLFINYEEAEGHWNRVLLSQILKENVYKQADDWTAEEKAERKSIFKHKMDEWGERLMVRHDPDSCYFSDLERWFKDLIGNNITPDVVIIDTIQSMLGDGKGPRWGDYELMMIKLERLAKEMNAVFIITAQQNNEAVKENRQVAKQSDIGGSVAIVQKCSVIMVLTSIADITKDESIDVNIMGVQILKNRITGLGFVHEPPMVKYVDDYKSYVDVEAIDNSIYDNGATLDELVSESDFSIL